MKSKYKAKKTKIDGIIFDSRLEAKRYADLKLLEKAKVIKDLRLQPRFTLQDKFDKNEKHYRSITYIADFSYVENNKKIVEDVKGVETDVYKIKKKLLLKQSRDKFIFREYKKGGIIKDY